MRTLGSNKSDLDREEGKSKLYLKPLHWQGGFAWFVIRLLAPHVWSWSSYLKSLPSSLVFSFRLFLYPVLHAASDSQEPHQLQISQISYKNNYTSILYPKFKMVAMHENFYARNGVEGRDHIPALPFWMAIVRIVQFVCHLQYALPQMHI